MKPIVLYVLLNVLLLSGTFLVAGISTQTSPPNNQLHAQANEQASFKASKSNEGLRPFFDTEINSTTAALSSQDLTIDNPLGDGAGYNIETQDGVKTFLRCTNNLNINGDFEFRDPNIGSYPTGTIFLLDWGDGTTSNQVENHIYSAGLYTLSYTITFPDGSNDTSTFRVFVGTEPEFVQIQLSGNNFCISDTDTYEFTVSSTYVPGTTYSVSISDGSSPIIIDTSSFVPGEPFTTTLQHEFLINSCNRTAEVGGAIFNNAFSISVTASNPCSLEGNFNSVGPVRVSEETEAEISALDLVCTGFDTVIRDISERGVNTSSTGCNTNYSRYWEISPNTYTLIGSNLGNDNGIPEDWTSWNSGSQNLDIVFDEPGNYQVTLVTRNNCEESRITQVVEAIEPIPPVEVEALGPEESCVDEGIMLTADLKGASGNITWSANVSGGSFDDNSAQDPIYTPPPRYTGEIIFTLTFENDDFSCENETDTHTVEIAGPLVEAGSYEPVCSNSSLTLDATFEDPSASIIWSSPDGGTFEDVNDPNTAFTPPTDFVGTLTLQIEINVPASTCGDNIAFVDIEIVPNGEIEVNDLEDEEFCNNELVPELIFNSPNGSNFRWEIDRNIGLSPTSGVGNIPSFTTQNPTEDPIVATVTVTPFLVTGNTSCDGNPEEFTITIQPDPIILGIEVLDNYELNNVSCFGADDGSITLSQEGEDLLNDSSYDFTWNGPDNFTSNTTNISGLAPGNYTLEIVEVDDPNECFFVVLELTIEEPEPLEVNSIATNLAFCFGEDDASLSFTISGGTPPYTVNSEEIEQSQVELQDLGPGVYDFEIEDANGCIIEFDITIPDEYINVVPPPTGEPRQEVCLEDLPITVSEINANGLEVQWFLSPDDDTPLPNDFPIREDIILYAKNLDRTIGCLSRESLEVRVVIIEGIPEINNYISVNDNRLNDNLNVVNIEQYPDNRMRIYNRYGKLVWETENYDNLENSFRGMANVGGTTKQNNFLPTGTYYYVLQYNSPCRGDIKKGFLQIDNTSR